jgi:putative flippase GtrA
VRLAARQFLRFSIVGTIGFFVDAGALQALIDLAGSDPWSGRVVSFLVSSTVTWLLNRRFTFPLVAGARRRVGAGREWSYYFALMAVGAVFNYGAYVATLLQWGLARDWPVIGVAVGSLAGLAVNFLGSKYLVFRAA